jgi:hypothetical protein
VSTQFVEVVDEFLEGVFGTGDCRLGESRQNRLIGQTPLELGRRRATIDESGETAKQHGDDEAVDEKPAKRGRPPSKLVSEEQLNKTAESEGLPQEFAKLLRQLYDECNDIRTSRKEGTWSLGDLANFASIAEGQVRAWVAGSNPVISKRDVYALCWALCGMADGSLDAKPKGKLGRRELGGRGKLGPLLNRLLRAAGYRPLEGRSGYDSNLVWERLSDSANFNSFSPKELDVSNVLRVGYFDSNPLFFPHREDVDERRSGKDRKHSPLGLGYLVTERLAAYMGVAIEWSHLKNWNDLTVALKSRSIDVLAPRIAAPRRFFGMKFTRSLPELTCGTNALINKECLGFVATGNHISYEKYVKTKSYGYMTRNVNEDWLERLVFDFMPGNIGEYAADLFRPVGSKIKPEFRKLADELASGEEWVGSIEHPWMDETHSKARCFVTGQLLCYDAMESGSPFADEMDYLIPLDKSVAPMAYAFGVDYTEDRLFSILNDCLELVFNDKEFINSIYNEHMKTLKNSEIYKGCLN